MLDPHIAIHITGNPGGCLDAIRADLLGNVTLTGFLPEPEYIKRLQAADVVIDLTSRADCLVCGAYEAVAAERPMVLSGNRATRHYSYRGAVYTANSVADLARAIREALERRDELRHECLRWAQLQVAWAAHFTQLVTSVDERVRA